MTVVCAIAGLGEIFSQLIFFFFFFFLEVLQKKYQGI